MATIEIPNVRQESTVLMPTTLKDNGVAVDWSGLQNIKAYMYSDAQRVIAGKCDVEVDGEDATVLKVTYAATKPQYLGVNSLLVRCKYHGREKSYDVPVLNFVERTAQATGVTVLDDPVIDVKLAVNEVSTSLLDGAIADALDAAIRADEAAEAAEHMVEIKTGPQGKSAYQVAVDNGFEGTEEQWLTSLTGPAGDSAYAIAVQQGFVGTKDQWLASLVGPQGKSAYQVAVDNGFEGTISEWLLSLKGGQGIPGVANAKYKQVAALPTASAATMDFIYLVESATAGVYNMSYTEEDAGAYSWKSLGTTAIQMDGYAREEELNQLEQKFKLKGPDLWKVTMPNGYLSQQGTKVIDSKYDSQQLPLTNGATYYVVPQVTATDNNARLFRVEGSTYTQVEVWKTSSPFSFVCPDSGNYVLQNIIYKTYSLIPPAIYEVFEMGELVEGLAVSNKVLEQVDRDDALLLSQIGQTGRAGVYVNAAGNYVSNNDYFCTPPIPFSGTEIGWHWHSQEMNTAACVVLFNSAGTKLDYWGAVAGIRGRTITTNKASAGCYLIASFKVDSFQDSYLRTDSTIPWKGAIFTEYDKFKYSGMFFEGIIHRGYSGVAPENTLPAFILAKTALYAKFVETDIEFTSDDVPVLLHDSTINRTARNADGSAISNTINIEDITYEQALTYDFGIWKGQEYAGTKIPTLDEFLQLCKVLGLVPLIELKDDVTWTSERIAIIAASVKRVGMQKVIRFGSFSPTVLGSISAYFPNARLVLAPFSVISGGKYTQAVISQLLDDADTLASAHNNEVVLSTHYGYMSIEIYNTIAARGYNTYSWTINNASLLADVNPNVVGVMSDDFDAARYMVDNYLDT